MNWDASLLISRRLVWGLCGGLAFLSACGWGEPKINLNPYEALGAITAEETSKLIGHRGGIVIVMEDPGRERDPVMDSQLDAFKAALKSSGKASVTAVEKVKMDPMQRMATGGAVPPDFFLQVMEKHPEASALVLFITFPALSSEAIQRVKQSATKIVVASACVPGYRKLLKDKVIHLALVPRLGEEGASARERVTLRDWFDADYVIGTPETSEAVPY